MEQISLFEGKLPFKITKPVRLITLFSGYDSQALALKYLGVPFEHYHTCEWAIPSIQALKDLHFAEDKTDYSKEYSKSELAKILNDLGVSADYNKPLSLKALMRYSEQKLRTIYNNIKASRNLVSICNVKGSDLEIINTNKYTYIMTYSFPCQDLSAAGKQKGMGREAETRSGLLWQVERLLKECKECKELPQVLLMENVPQVIYKKNIKDFSLWIAFLESLGYKSKWEIFNAKEFGIPQNRARCFMVSVLGDYWFQLPQQKVQLKHTLDDILEKDVDKKYYLTKSQIKRYEECNTKNEIKGNRFRFEPIVGGIAKSILTKAGSRPCDNYIIIQKTKQLE